MDYIFSPLGFNKLKKEDCFVLQMLKSWEVEEEVRLVLAQSRGRLMETRELLRSAIGGSVLP